MEKLSRTLKRRKKIYNRYEENTLTKLADILIRLRKKVVLGGYIITASGKKAKRPVAKSLCITIYIICNITTLFV